MADNKKLMEVIENMSMDERKAFFQEILDANRSKIIADQLAEEYAYRDSIDQAIRMVHNRKRECHITVPTAVITVDAHEHVDNSNEVRANSSNFDVGRFLTNNIISIIVAVSAITFVLVKLYIALT